MEDILIRQDQYAQDSYIEGEAPERPGFDKFQHKFYREKTGYRSSQGPGDHGLYAYAEGNLSLDKIL
jgi:hypothetical protein